MVVFGHQGKFVKSWGKEFQGGAHGLHIRKEGSTEFLYCATSSSGGAFRRQTRPKRAVGFKRWPVEISWRSPQSEPRFEPIG
jgi:hypothetical protein